MKKGRSRKYSGKVNLKSIDVDYLETIHKDEQSIIYSAVIYSKALKRNIKLVYKQLIDKKNRSYLPVFSTDLLFGALDILRYYKNRFQVEFLYRDGKQEVRINYIFSLTLR